MLDERSDWYDLANNTWLNKDQRDFATQQLDLQKKKQEEIDSKMTVDVNLETGVATQRLGEVDPEGIFSAQIEQVNAYMADESRLGKHGDKYKPFEGSGNDSKQSG